MPQPIYPCFWFNGQAKEAADYYCTVFNGAQITTDTPMVVIVELWGKKVMGLNGGPMFTINPSISLFVNCATVSETHEIWNKLMEGGKALMPIDKYPWSEQYGWLQDKFGITWQISVAPNGEAGRNIRPSMLFTGNCFGKAEEAINFYRSIFAQSETGMMVHYPDGDANAGKAMYSEFALNGYQLIAMDGPGAHDYTFSEGVSLVVECDTQHEIDNFWNKLTEGGQESMCGWLKDAFGVSWQIVPTVLGKLMTDPEKAPRVMQAFMKMKKFDIETLLNA
jgi:predicted 3-demethylubiquinone-9 3-methyltransferase (glyoxalase superfamily)